MENHKHIFKNVGGGCLIDGDVRTLCDDHYRCDCGAEFRVRTSLEGHTYLPKTIYGDEPDEIKKLELKEIHKAMDDTPKHLKEQPHEHK